MSEFIKLNHTGPPQEDPRTLQRERGFTLIELLVIVAIIGVLASIAIPMYSGYVDKAKITIAMSSLDAIRKNLEAYHIDNEEYPPAPIDFSTGIDSAGRTAFSGASLDQINQDMILVSYNTATNNSTYTLVANARNNDHTELTLTPTTLTRAP